MNCPVCKNILLFNTLCIKDEKDHYVCIGQRYNTYLRIKDQIFEWRRDQNIFLINDQPQDFYPELNILDPNLLNKLQTYSNFQ